MDSGIALSHPKPAGLRRNWLVTIFVKRMKGIKKMREAPLAQRPAEQARMVLNERWMRVNGLR